MEKTYEEAINELIPVASAIADRRVEDFGTEVESIEGADGKFFNYSFHTKFFHEEMNRLARKNGLRDY